LYPHSLASKILSVPVIGFTGFVAALVLFSRVAALLLPIILVVIIVLEWIKERSERRHPQSRS
jgi:hypothetical protein